LEQKVKNSNIRFALVGCGRIAKRHAELLGNHKIPGAELAAVCDVDEVKAQYYGQKFGVPVFSNMEKMVKTENIDVVSILTPSGLHAEHTLKLAPYKKHILVEKPMALLLGDANAMIEACDRYGCRLFVVKQNRFNVPVVKLRQAIDGGRFGKLVMGTVRVRWSRNQEYYDMDAWRGTWAMDGGVLTNQASHHIDLLQWMMGDVESVMAMSRTALVDIEAEDTAVVILRFRNGAIGVIEATTATRPNDLEGSISILGEHGTVEIGGFAVNQMKTWQFDKRLPEDESILEKYSVNPPNVYGYGHHTYYTHVVECLQKNTHQLVDGFTGLKSLELINAIYESIETGREIFLRFRPKMSRLGYN